MKADMIIKGARIFTSDRDNPVATALVVRDGKFAYVGDEAGISEYEGEVLDLAGKFIMPGIIDSHLHVTSGVGFDYADTGQPIEAVGKEAILGFMADYIKDNPGLKRYRFMLAKKRLEGAELDKSDLDAICPDAELQILESECHSTWVNSKILELHGITDDSPDPVPGLSYYVRKDGHVTGNLIEVTAQLPIIFDNAMDLTDEQVDAAIMRWVDFCVDHGVVGAFDAGNPGFHAFDERVYARLRDLDEQGRLPVYVDGCYVVAAQWEAEDGLKGLKRFRQEFDTEHLKVHTMKIFMDGTQKIYTAAMVTPYEGTDITGNTAFSAEDLAEVLKKLNAEGLDIHLHCVGERASRTVLDAAELARRDLGDDFRVRVTCAHLEIQDDADLMRFAELGVNANFTPWWHAGDLEEFSMLLGAERASKMFRCKTLWDSGALVTWSSDNVAFADFTTWNPYLGMEIGMTRTITERTRLDEDVMDEPFPPAGERMGIEEMILGYTINGARQLGIEGRKGSITAGKDADFLVFDRDLTTAEQEGLSNIKPGEVYFCGKKLK